MKTITTWYLTTTGIFLVLIITYLFLHRGERQGTEIIKLSKQETTDINLILFGSGAGDTTQPQKPLDDKEIDLRKATVYRYIFSVRKPYPDDSTRLVHYLDQFDLSEFSIILANYPIRTRSYFWLTQPGVFAEIIFWAWFGLFASLFYSVSEAYRSGDFSRREISVHISKFIYAPLCAVVIFLSLTLLSKTGDLEIVEFSHSTIVLSFILGFFSGRAIELLTRVKDILLPLGKAETTVPDTDETSFENLSTEEKYALMEEAVKANYQAWKTMPNFTGVQVGKKTTRVDGSEVETSVDAIVLQVAAKSKLLAPWKRFPSFVSFKGYKIPTDIVEASETKAHHYRQPTTAVDIAQSGIKSPGAGISRVNDTRMGTLGLKVKRAATVPKYYLLSCYHVLFAKELDTDMLLCNTSASTQQEAIVCPARGNSPIAYIREGTLDTDMDAGIAELINEASVLPQIYALSGPNDIYEVTPADISNGLQVNIFGRRSGKQHGKLKGKSAIQSILYTNTIAITFEGLLSVSKISDEGDSGAIAVTNRGKVVGMVIGGDTTYSYLIPISKILNHFNIEICKP